jgi:hypothetical protein
LAYIFAKNFEVEDVEITGNDIKIKDSESFGKNLVGSRAIIAENKIQLAANRAQQVNDKGSA